MVMPESSERHRTVSRRPHGPAIRPVAGARVPLRRLLRVASVASGIQFGWALQLSLLTPYIQELGIPHAWSSLIWLCGPLSGLFVQPLAGHMSDRCTSRHGRRRPFIVAGAVSIVIAVLIIGHSADLGWLIGDRGGVRHRAIGFFVVGFWLLDVANNFSQGPCRALLADLTGSFSGWYKILPFTLTNACSVNCANLKSAFLIDIVFIAITTYLSVSAVQELPLDSSDRSSLVVEEGMGQSNHASEAFLWELFRTFRYFSGYMWVILLVTSLTWIGWFPFTLFDTDWMGREIYGGKPNEGQSYNSGVRMGAFGLMLNSVVLGITSLLMEKLCRKWGAGFVWGISNIFMALCFLAMLVLTYVAKNMGYIGHDFPPNSIVSAALIIFALLGAPLAITYSVPYAMICSRVESLQLGQGLSVGVLNLAVVIPQVVVSLGSGPWDQLFGGGNSPAFAVAALAAFASGLIAILALPRSGAQKPRTLT
ncbi:sucrose transport protein SUC4 isoform X2 [Momordica charantia]|uniref:Sucrose transport protein SUC4 isoform X2 n=1 Tax=Momordica charantia TaxID=3673 RepID=A0A6J1BT99_MOMCH|nr:sucrose transport protein SUC4 isoform X2 [Momordica charantia]